jgi:hypothetical protein
LVLFFFVISEINKEIDSKISQINQEKIEFENVKQKLISLQDYVKRKDIEPLNRQQALKVILNKANFFLKKKDAKLIDDLKEENKTLYLTMSINIPVNNKKQIKDILENFTNDKYPLIEIKEFKVESGQTQTFIKITFKLIQVYKG